MTSPDAPSLDRVCRVLLAHAQAQKSPPAALFLLAVLFKFLDARLRAALRAFQAADVDDALADGYLALARALDRYDPDRSGGYSWVRTIVLNGAITRWRRTAARATPTDFAEFDLAADAPTALDTLVRAETVQQVRAAVGRLSRADRATYKTRFEAGRKCREFPGVRASTAGGRIHRLKLRARAALAGVG